MADITTNPPAPGAPAAQPAAGQKAPVQSPAAALKAQLLGILKAGSGQFDIGLVNRGLMVMIGILAVVFVSGVSRQWNELKKLSAKEFTVASMSKTDMGFNEIAAMKGVAYYIGKLSGRDIFHRQSKSELASNEPVFSAKMADMTANLKLVGVSMSDNPDAMIEDTKLQKTYFVKMGSMVGDLRVDMITRDKVILKYNKESFELR